MQKLTKLLAYWTCLGMFLILVMGALVTKTESGRGCGDDWPLCNGNFIPAYTISSFIEYSHRLVVGVITMLLLATTVLVILFFRKRKDAVCFALGAVFFTLLQAVMGALAVVWPQSSAVLALHFGLSLLAFACTLLLALTFTSWGDYAVSGRNNPSTGNRAFHGLVWFTMIYSYVVVYLGAFVRHTESSGGCYGWPLCNGEFVPELSGATGIVFAHRVGALLLLIFIVILFLSAKKRYAESDLRYLGSKWTLLIVVLQIVSGAVVTWSIGNDLFYLFAGMIHAVIVACLFGLLSYMCVLTLYERPQSK
jgi:heme a synthase